MQRMRDILGSSLAKSLGPSASIEDRLAAAWPVACGTAIASRTRVAGFEKGVLRVGVAGPAWLAQMQTLRPRLAREVGRIAEVALADILFFVEDRG